MPSSSHWREELGVEALDDLGRVDALLVGPHGDRACRARRCPTPSARRCPGAGGSGRRCRPAGRRRRCGRGAATRWRTARPRPRGSGDPSVGRGGGIGHLRRLRGRRRCSALRFRRCDLLAVGDLGGRRLRRPAPPSWPLVPPSCGARRPGPWPSRGSAGCRASSPARCSFLPCGLVAYALSCFNENAMDVTSTRPTVLPWTSRCRGTTIRAGSRCATGWRRTRGRPVASWPRPGSWRRTGPDRGASTPTRSTS